MVIRTSRYGRFLACSRYPECKGTKPLSTGVKCPLDGGDIIERRSKKGKVFWSCSNWPQCKFASWYKPVNEICPECGSEYMVERRDRQGDTYLLCPNKDCKHKKTLKSEEPLEVEKK
jgi:DNA topoisomerase-1